MSHTHLIFKTAKIALCVLLCFSLLAAFVPADIYRVSADTTLEQDLEKQSELEKRLASLKAQNKQIKNDLAKAKKEMASQAVIKSNLEQQIATLEEEIEVIERLIECYVSMAEIQKAKQIGLQLSLTTNYENFKETLRYNYIYGQHTEFELIFSAESLTDFLTGAEYSKRLFDYDKKLLTELEEDAAELEEVSDRVEATLSNAEICREELESNKQTLKDAEREVEDLIADLEKDSKKKQEFLDSYEEEMNRIDKELEVLIQQIQSKQAYVGGIMLFPLPAKSYTRVSSYWGPRKDPFTGAKANHSGMDFPAPKNTPIYAANDGEVILARNYGGYGNCVMLDHGGGIVTVYGHANKLLVKVGQKVKRGDQIALVGTTGRSTGNHLHFEVRKNGKTVDPMDYIVLPK